MYFRKNKINLALVLAYVSHLAYDFQPTLMIASHKKSFIRFFYDAKYLSLHNDSLHNVGSIAYDSIIPELDYV